MTQSPDYSPSARPLARGPLSKAGLISLILGILACIPLSSVAAIFFAIVGFRATRAYARQGRGLAIAGLVLGIVGTIGWAIVGGFVLIIVAGSATPRSMVHQFASDVAKGNVAAAAAQCDATISAGDIQRLHDSLASYGSYSDLTCYSANLNATGSGTQCVLTGMAQFSSGKHAFNAVARKDSKGDWKIAGFHVR